MDQKLEQIQARLAEIAKLSLEEQPDAFAQLNRELDEELNPTENTQGE